MASKFDKMINCIFQLTIFCYYNNQQRERERMSKPQIYMVQQKNYWSFKFVCRRKVKYEKAERLWNVYEDEWVGKTVFLNRGTLLWNKVLLGVHFVLLLFLIFIYLFVKKCYCHTKTVVYGSKVSHFPIRYFVMQSVPPTKKG